MNIDLGILGALCREGMAPFLDTGVTSEMLEGQAVICFQFIENHWRDYQKIPSPETVFQETGVNVNNGPVEPVKFWADQIKSRTLFETLRANLAPVAEHLEKHRPEEAFQEIEALVFKIRNQTYSNNRPQPLFADAEKIYERYLDAKKGLTGVPCPWPSMNRMTKGWQPGDFALFTARPEMGKSLHPETKVIMADYSVREVQHVNRGDQLLGPDSKPRNVLGVHRGREEMFEVIPNKGEPWKCNRSHILSLKMSSDNGASYKRGQIFNLSIDEYLSKNGKFKHHAKLWRTGIDMPEQELPFDPYLIGLWIGDGGMNQPTFSFDDQPLFAYLESFAAKNGYRINDESSEGRCPTYRLSRAWKKNPLLLFIREHMVRDGEKRIPSSYLINSEENRLRLLAGILDTDGFMTGNCFEVVTKYPGLAEDILFLARSLGFAAYSKLKKSTIKSTGFVGFYHRIGISGHVDRIPCLLERRKAKPRQKNTDVLSTGFELKSLGEGEFYGVELDGDHLYLLGDFTVTHNTWLLLINAHWAWLHGRRVLIGSTEMSMDALQNRMAALIAKLSYSAIRDGELTPSYEAHFQQTLHGLKNDKRMMIMGGGFGVSLNSFEAAIIETKPDIAFADGAYLFRGNSRYKDKSQNIADTFNGFKEIALRHKVPVVGTSQLNRSGDKKNSTPVDLERLAFSDNAGMVSDWVFAVNQTKEMTSNKELELRPLKTRESGKKGYIKINWDFYNQDFSEKLEENKEGNLEAVMRKLDDMEFSADDPETPF